MENKMNHENEHVVRYVVTSSKFPEGPCLGRGSRSFHMRRKVRQRYGLSGTIFGLNGNVILVNHSSVREFVTKANIKRARNQALKPGEINAIGLIDELWHYIISLYGRKEPRLWQRALAYVQKRVDARDFRDLLLAFIEDFPPGMVVEGKQTGNEYLDSSENDEPVVEIETEELLLVHLANVNPAFSPYLHMFEDVVLLENPAYKETIFCLKEFFGTLAAVDTTGETLYEALYSPIKHFPTDLAKQVAYLIDRFGLMLTPLMNQRLLSGLDLLREERKEGGHGSAPAKVMQYTGEYPEPKAFSFDHDWMPDVVLLAKNAFVWLYQLSKEYGLNIRTLTEVPDQELDRLAETGINSLWLIGIWERSHASGKIKQAMGGNDTIASAYSLDDYQIARHLGGWAGLQSLKERAWQRGIRLASDMVPNHTGMDSKLVAERPDLFLQRRLSPFATYTFNSENLSHRDNVKIYLEDHYYSKEDAAVVFKRVDAATGHTTYIYHGNDGTSTPWNDTAQLDFTNPETREVVIQQILEVARHFPIIRFDAAMVLVKRHIQRLWFPLPGHGGDIPSRSDHSMTVKEFDDAIPLEFWREVVDRIAKEVPETLLLAEAFWMLEGFFVRSLGMHRVYNSAFMHMLKDEENGKYRQSLKNTLEFDPEILKRFVNFMSNPDEEPAVVQFGKGDKYFGVCALMCTMPGLPLFAHGQIRGLTEKYGMEYARPHLQEQDDLELMSRHRQEIFPLLHKRYRFSEASHWRLYDAFRHDGSIDENVFAYSNSAGLECSIVLYNNSSHPTSGTIKQSVPFAVPHESHKEIITQQLAEVLSLHNEKKYFLVMREHHRGLWYIRPTLSFFTEGFKFELRPYEYQVFWENRELYDHDGMLQTLYEEVGTEGMLDFDLAMKELRLRPLYHALQRMLNPRDGSIGKLLTLFYGQDDEIKIMASLYTDCEMCLVLLKSLWRVDSKIPPYMRHAERHFKAFYNLLGLISDEPFWHGLLGKRFAYVPFLSTWISVKILAYWRYMDIGPESKYLSHLSLINDWLLDRHMAEIWMRKGWGNYWVYDKYLKALVDIPIWDGKQPWRKYLEMLFESAAFCDACGVNKFNGVLWYNQEDFTTMIDLIFLLLYYEKVAHTTHASIDIIPRLEEGYQQIDLASQISDCQWAHLLSVLSHDGPTSLSSKIKQSLLTSKKKNL